MTALLVRCVWILLAAAWGGGLWAVLRRRRHLTERDIRRAAAWRAAYRGGVPHDDPLVAALDCALREGCEATPVAPAEVGLPSDPENG